MSQAPPLGTKAEGRLSFARASVQIRAMIEDDSPLARNAMALIGAGIAAADPARCTLAAMTQVLADPPDPGGGWRIIALGKAARAMAGAALSLLPGASALVVTNAGNDAPLAGARMLTAGHPVPDRAGAAAACEVEAMLRDCRPQDRLLALISGGGSAMLPAPVAGVGLEEKQQVSRLLLASGADIGQVNLIRQALSRLKGGGWLRLCRAPVTALILSDVPGDDLRLVASGPTVAPAGRRADAARVARRLGIWPELPASVREALASEAPAPQVPAGPVARNLLIGSNRHSLRAMVAAGAVDGGLPLHGDVEACARLLVASLRDRPAGVTVAFGGETTVRLRGDGMGGRNQELALRFALAAQQAGLCGDWRFAAVGTDGRDGPGQAAGGLVGPHTLARIRAAGLDPVRALSRNDSTPALRAGGALVMTGPTGTNVADLAVFVSAGAVSQTGTPV